MPKDGFRSITISQPVYDRFQKTYLQEKDELAVKGIRSLSGYVSYMLEESMTKSDNMTLHAPMLKKISVDDDRIVILDISKNRIAEVALQQGKIFCQLCEQDNCLHVGYALAQPDIYGALKEKGIQIPS